MQFLTDENISPEIVSALRNAGHSVLDTKEEGWHGKSDSAIIQIAKTKVCIIITHDKDFLKQQTVSIILLRFYNQRPTVVIPYLLALLKSKYMPKLKQGAVAVLSEQRVELHY